MARQTVSKCGNERCNATSTPLWRKGWRDPTTGQIVMLCNACGLHYKKGHFCSYCHGIYKESDADDTKNPWIGCDRCSRWIHKRCEETHNEGRLHDVVVKGEERKLFLCPECRDVEQEALDSGDVDSLQEFHESLQYSRRKKPGLDKSKTGIRGKKKQSTTTGSSTSTARTAKTKSTGTPTSPTANKRERNPGIRKQKKLIRHGYDGSKVSTSFLNSQSGSAILEAPSPGGSSIVMESPTGSPLPPTPHADGRYSYYYPHSHAYHHNSQQAYAQQYSPNRYYASQQGGATANWHDYGNYYAHPAGYYSHPQQQQQQYQYPSSTSTTWPDQQLRHHMRYYAVSPSSPYRPQSALHAFQPFYQHHTLTQERENDMKFHMARQRMVIRIDQERLSKKYHSKFVQSPSMTKLGTLWAVCDELLSSADFTC